MEYQNLLTENREGIFYITINRPDKLNALNKATLAELHLAVTHANSSNDIAGIIITGSGQKAFVAGADISEFSAFDKEQGKELARQGHDQVFNLIENSSKPVIAAVNGFALGGGLELAMACHIRIASDNARMGLPETTLGLIPGYGGTQRLPRLVGKGRALEMILTAEMISAVEAHRMGLVNHVVAPDELLPKAESMMRVIMSRSPNALAAAIRAVNASYGDKGFETEINEFSNCFKTEEFNEGVLAFLQKRRPNFKN